MATGNLNIPVIDISSLVTKRHIGDTKTQIKDTVYKIGQACKEWGFFYVIDHQVDSGVMSDFQQICREFFHKPKEFKQTVARTETNLRGYSDAEFTKQKLDWKEVFDFGCENPRKSYRTLEVDGETPWRGDWPQMKAAMVKYFESMHSLAEILMASIFQSLGVDPEMMKNEFEGSKETSLMRVNYYPPCPDKDTHLGVGPHADPSAVTVLWQDLNVTSLQVQKNDQFYDIYPLADSYVVNIGDMVQVWSNGLYQAPVHRVLADYNSERYSAPFFYTPSYSCNVKPLAPCITSANPCRYRQINWGEFRKGRFQGDYADVGEEIQIKHFLV